ncbi:MAG TPA: zf-HC2 domain-containing protein [Acidobacteriota bacterium]|nr:zf-HC2 domain-containing protein [Acidobacteriota bacterium]
MRVCDEFDRYRDGGLNAAERDRFEGHLAGCRDCRERNALLNNVVRALTAVSSEMPRGLPERIARRAFTQRASWDALVISWLKPAPALIALVLTVLLFSYLWLVPGFRQAEPVTHSEYEALVNESYGLNQGSGAGQVRGDDDLLNWLEQEGGSR